MDLTSLLRPESIAVVGATERPDSYGGNVLENLRRAGFEGPVYGVNPGRESAHGFPCFPTLAEIPEPVDAVAVAIPAPLVPGVIAEAGELGCGGAVVLSAGFAEVASGQGLEEKLRAAAIKAGLPLCGPNGNGIIAAGQRAPIWGDSVAPLQPGGVAMISQSGNVAVNALGSRRGMRFHTLISSGNQAVLDASDWLLALTEVGGVRSVAMFLEQDGDGSKLATALAACAEAEIGVAVLKVGSSQAGAAAAAAHTAAVAGDQRVFRALVEEAGAAWAADPHDLLELAKALAEPRARPARTGGLAVLTCSGGDSGLAADEAERIGLSLPELAPETTERLDDLLPEAATIGNPLDYTAMIWGDVERLREIIRAVADDPAIDQLLVFYDHPRDLSAASEETWGLVRAGIVAGAEATDAALIVSSTLPDLIDDDAAAELAALGIAPLAGLRASLACALALRRPAGDAGRLREIAAGAAPAAGSNRGGEWLGELEAKELLRDAGVAVPRGREVLDESDAVAAWGELGGPVALKLSAPGLLHKTDVGALALSLDDEPGLREAHRRLSGIDAGPSARMLAEEMLAPGVELMVGARRDGVVPALALALGGVWTELLDDVAVVPLPASTERIAEALLSLRAAPLLTGGRGGEPLAVKAAAELASRAGMVLLDRELSLLELNPVVVGRDGAVAVDAVARGSGGQQLQ
ncbi:MAG: CoA-binding protein [Solirubrobacterales bacterium]|nr:CoA-binding protein [Solirubrobacterales bacterium]